MGIIAKLARMDSIKMGILVFDALVQVWVLSWKGNAISKRDNAFANILKLQDSIVAHAQKVFIIVNHMDVASVHVFHQLDTVIKTPLNVLVTLAS